MAPAPSHPAARFEGDPAERAALLRGEGEGYAYARYANPTCAATEQALGVGKEVLLLSDGNADFTTGVRREGAREKGEGEGDCQTDRLTDRRTDGQTDRLA